MNNAKYLIRVDDICEGLNLDNFVKLIEIFKNYDLKPIIAVIPKNVDKKLIYNNSIYGQSFWKLIQDLEKKYNWKVGIHGYEHNYVTNSSGLLKINNFSEFAGLTYHAQKIKIKKSIEIMKLYNLSTDLFIAPGHSFDKQTLKALLAEGVCNISDGFYRYPGMDKNGLFWIPQQLWNFELKKKGVWTVNFHINHWNKKNFVNLEKDLVKYKNSIVDFDYVKKFYSQKKLNNLDIFENYLKIKKNNLVDHLVKIRNIFR